ncbi:hypothetical protein [Gracilimonas mengyeensis]|uniref:Uncharacterized protein n=1 Tax=Gracilimonas mengyeensis TaxID=1302730 RepID=A0A521CQC7_9BACT|nr:hypothetical protein [Gracilimonas mengyeensis]SMO61674.1 hypothetical protein SAMN06265219_10662 [Gracilimonas mengyeensis]
MARKKKTDFQIYRYQILPISRNIQKDFFDGIESIEELIAKKNQFFEEAILKINDFDYSYSELAHKIRHKDDDFFLFKFGVNRSISRETREFTEEEIDNWPSFYVGIWNSPDKQFFVVEERRDAFQQTKSFVKLFEENVNRVLERYNLVCLIEPLFEENSFWAVVDEYQERIVAVEFELITPNLANISGKLSDELKDFAKATNSQKTNMKIQSDKSSHLDIQEENKNIDGLVDYSSEGGGDIKFRIKNLKKMISLGESVKTIEIDDIYISGINSKEITDLLKDLLE